MPHKAYGVYSPSKPRTTLKILRYIFGTLFLLLSLSLGGLAYLVLFVSEQIPKYLDIAGLEINIGYMFGGVALVFLFIAGALFPFGGGPKKPRNLSKSAARKLLKREAELRRISDPTRYTDASFTQEGAGEYPDENIATYSRLEDPQAMARLVTIEQGELSRDIVTKLVREYYPDLLELVNRVEERDHTSLETIGRHIISIARNKLKLTDTELSDNQFSVFQENVFKEEQEAFLQIYKPVDRSNLNDEQRAFVGKVADKRAWEGAQRRVRGERTDWQDLSLVNAAELLD